MSILKFFCSVSRLLVATLSLGVLVAVSAAKAELSVAIGPTTIPRGDATGVRDITVSNEFFAVAFAVDTAPPWGVARGGIVDIAPIRDGKIAYDIASLADFMPNIWSSWPTTYQRVSVDKKTSDEVIIRTVRDWGDVELQTVFRILDGDSKIHIVTRMTNTGDELLEGLMSGYVVWPDGGFLFGVPGLPDTFSSPEDDALANWSASYGEHWALGLHAPFAETVAYNGRDRYLKHDLGPGESRSFEAWLQIENDGTLAPLAKAEIDFQQLESGRVRGRVVSDDGEPVARPAVVILKNGKTYAWALGNDGDYEIDLPSGQYELYATGRGYAKGETKNVTVWNGSVSSIDFNDVKSPGMLNIQVLDKATRQPLDARISIRGGYRPLIRYFGKDTFFTELGTEGETTVTIAPGKYVFDISAGGGFTSVPQSIETVVESAATRSLKAEISVLATPHRRGWYNADLHHHSDVLDGFTEAAFVLRSELAAGVDIAFLSDHDSVVNNHAMQILAAQRGIHFIAGTELSPSWAHFNAFPLDAGATADIDTGKASVQEIFAAARRMGADIIEVNHPYSGYGYFQSLEQSIQRDDEITNAVPGGYDAGFDLVEMTSGDNTRALQRVWQMWNEGQRVYLAGGSDAHDVWKEESGSARAYVHVDGDLSIEKFIAALKVGHSYASQGPIVYPELMFGSELEHAAGQELTLAYSVQAVSGLRSVQLIERGSPVDIVKYDGETALFPVQFSVHPAADTWYSLIIEDMHGKIAYTNPLWVTVRN